MSNNFPTLFEHIADIPREIADMPLRAAAIIMICEDGEVRVLRNGMTNEQLTSEILPAIIEGDKTKTEILTRPQ